MALASGTATMATMAKDGTTPGPTAAMTAPMTNSAQGIMRAWGPAAATILRASRSSVPFACNLPNRNVVPSRILNRFVPHDGGIGHSHRLADDQGKAYRQYADVDFFDETECDGGDKYYQGNDGHYVVPTHFFILLYITICFCRGVAAAAGRFICSTFCLLKSAQFRPPCLYDAYKNK